MLRLPWEVKDLFREWLAEHFPDRAAHVMSLVRAMRGGRDNDPQFGTRMHATGPVAELIRQRFQLACRRWVFQLNATTSLPTHLFRPASSYHNLDCRWTLRVSWEPDPGPRGHKVSDAATWHTCRRPYDIPHHALGARP